MAETTTNRAGRRVRPALTALLACAALLGACGGDDGDKQADDRPFKPAVAPVQTAAQPAPGTVSTADGATRKATLADARRAVDADRYAAALRTLPALSAGQRQAIRERVANRLAKKAAAALDRGNTGRVESMLAQAEDYPKTTLVEQVREDYEEAVKAATQRRNDLLLERQREHRERRQKSRAARAEAIAREAHAANGG
jgi:hypothetical protein